MHVVHTLLIVNILYNGGSEISRLLVCVCVCVLGQSDQFFVSYFSIRDGIEAIKIIQNNFFVYNCIR